MIWEWLHRRRKSLRLELREFEPAGQWLPGLNDLWASFEIDGRRFEGRAQDADRGLALEKACAEAIERAAYALDEDRARADSRLLERLREADPQRTQWVMTSSGYAAHSDPRRAREAARRELIERDLLMCNVLTDAPLRPLPPLSLRANSPFSMLRTRLLPAGVELRAACLRSDFPEHVVACAAFGRNHDPTFGVVLGLGISKHPRRALDKAVQECLMMVLGLLCGRALTYHSPRAFLRLDTFDFTAHWLLGMHREVGSAYQAKFAALAPSPSPKRVGERHLRGYAYRQIELPAYFSSCPVVVVQARHPLLQPVVVGPPCPSDLRRDRLQTFLRNVRLSGLSVSAKRIHILG